MFSRFSACYYAFRRIQYKRVAYTPEYGDITPEQYPARRDDQDWWQYERPKRDWWRDHRVLVQPEPKIPFDSVAYDNGLTKSALDLKEEYGKKGRPLQIIVKLANIELTPEKPEYPGGVWHVEGKLVCLVLCPNHRSTDIQVL